MTKIKIDGMSCEHCVAAVTKALNNVEGVTKVISVDLKTGQAEIEGNPENPSLVKAIEEEGYQAEVVE